MLNAVALSLLIHFLLVVAIEVGNKAGFWRFSAVAALNQGMLEEVRRTDEELKKAREEQAKKAEEEAAMIFVDIDPAEADPRDQPKETPFYSTATTSAANPKTTLDETQPGFDGAQTDIMKTRDSAAAKAAQPAPKPEPEMRPEPMRPSPQPPGDPAPEPVEPAPQEPPPAPAPEPDGVVQVAKVKPNDNPFSELLKPSTAAAKPQQPPPPRQRVRTLDEARAQKGIIEGKQMRQQGGVRRFAIESSMDVRATPFGAYDAAFIAAVQARWFALLDEHDSTRGQAGRVVLDFRLTEDGRITNMRVASNEVGETLGWLCQRAVLDPAPYAAFPPDLRRMLRHDYRDVRFSFLYSY